MRFLLVAMMLFPAWALAQEAAWPILKPAADEPPLAGTKLLDWEGDLAMRMVEGIDEFLDREIDAAMKGRGAKSGTREELARKLGMTRDARPHENELMVEQSLPIDPVQGSSFSVRRVRWKAFGMVTGVGLLLEPTGEIMADVIVVPDADQLPEELAGFARYSGSGGSHPAGVRLAAVGCRVLIPLVINRDENAHGMSNREWLHRPAWELGRTLAGYEVQKILAAVDCLKRLPKSKTGKLGVVGWGEGGRLALYAAALDERIDGALVSGYFGPRHRVWDEPADRTVFGLLNGHSDAEIGRLVSPRPLVIEWGNYPEYGFRLDENGVPERLNRGAGKRGKPGKMTRPDRVALAAELKSISAAPVVALFREGKPALGDDVLGAFLKHWDVEIPPNLTASYAAQTTWLDERIKRRHAQQMAEIEHHNQWALIDSQRVRAELVKGLNLKSVADYEESAKPLRELFSREVIGEFASLQKLPAPHPRTRALQKGPKTVSYEVVLNVHPGVFAYGILTLPKDMKRDGSEKRPVVVCQHGLEGRPQSTVGEPDHHYYKAFATRLAERGFITFSPQNIYIGHDRFRILQFKANALGCTLFSIMVPQHRQITEWLASLAFVDAERIGFYGLSYGGKSAMRIPPLVDRYCLSICSADFNEWIWKNAATDAKSLRYSYANKGEYEIFEFNLGNTFNYYEMAALICPRPFMVERGHFDGVAPDETVAYEYGKVRHLYAAKLGIGERTTIEWFVGPHTINGVGTYEFLHRHLKWPER